MYDGLPEISYAYNDVDGRVIAIRRGEMGFYPYATDKTADELNQMLDVTRAQAAAMHFGSMFGWDKPGADPAAYDVNGVPLARNGRSENYLRNAEMYLEQNYDQIDGLMNNLPDASSPEESPEVPKGEIKAEKADKSHSDGSERSLFPKAPKKNREMER